MPDRAQRAGVALERRRGHVIEHQGAVGQMPGGQGVFDGVLARQHPVHRRIQVVLIDSPTTPSTCPSELVAVSARSPRAVASFEAGAITVAASIAHTRSRLREGAGSISSAMPSFSAVPNTAATCPCGRLRVISNASARSEPLSASP